MRNDEYLREQRGLQITRSDSVSPGRRAEAITCRPGLSSRKRQFESGRDCPFPEAISTGPLAFVSPRRQRWAVPTGGLACCSVRDTDAARAGAAGLRSSETAAKLRDELLEPGIVGAVQAEPIAPGRHRDR